MFSTGRKLPFPKRLQGAQALGEAVYGHYRLARTFEISDPSRGCQGPELTATGKMSMRLLSPHDPGGYKLTIHGHRWLVDVFLFGLNCVYKFVANISKTSEISHKNPDVDGAGQCLRAHKVELASLGLACKGHS